MNSQMNTAFTMSVLGEGLNVSTSSNPLSFNSINCLHVSNGVSKYLATKTGEFINNCIVDINYIKINIHISPNPFLNDISVKFKFKIDHNNQFKISIYNNYGILVKMYNVSQDHLLTGFKMQLIELPTGTYFLQINSAKVNEIFKIMKYE